MAKRTIRIRCDIAEIRRRGDISVVLPAEGSGDTLFVLPRDAVEITSILEGISGAVHAVLVKEFGQMLLVDIPAGQAVPIRASVPRSAVV
jgi:hypothetical protein